MTEKPHTNGNGVTFRWVVGFVTAAFITVGGWAWSSTVDRVIELERTVQARGERIATAEAKVQALETQLSRIEAKLDVLLEERRK